MELREALNMQRRRLTLSSIGALLAGRSPAEPDIDPRGIVREQSSGPHAHSGAHSCPVFLTTSSR